MWQPPYPNVSSTRRSNEFKRVCLASQSRAHPTTRMNTHAHTDILVTRSEQQRSCFFVHYFAHENRRVVCGMVCLHGRSADAVDPIVAMARQPPATIVRHATMATPTTSPSTQPLSASALDRKISSLVYYPIKCPGTKFVTLNIVIILYESEYKCEIISHFLCAKIQCERAEKLRKQQLSGQLLWPHNCFTLNTDTHSPSAQISVEIVTRIHPHVEDIRACSLHN